MPDLTFQIGDAALAILDSSVAMLFAGDLVIGVGYGPIVPTTLQVLSIGTRRGSYAAIPWGSHRGYTYSDLTPNDDGLLHLLGMQLCLGASLPVYLVDGEGLWLSAASWIFGLSQFGTMVGRLVNGCIAARPLSPFTVVIGLGFAMAPGSASAAMFTLALPVCIIAVSSCVFGAAPVGRMVFYTLSAPSAAGPSWCYDQRCSEHQFPRRAGGPLPFSGPRFPRGC